MAYAMHERDLPKENIMEMLRYAVAGAALLAATGCASGSPQSALLTSANIQLAPENAVAFTRAAIASDPGHAPQITAAAVTSAPGQAGAIVEAAVAAAPDQREAITQALMEVTPPSALPQQQIVPRPPSAVRSSFTEWLRRGTEPRLTDPYFSIRDL
jgi:hypothetical protein